jgi:SulP family sulfate permease
VSTSLSASSLNESAGARSQAASLITGGLVLATLLVLAPLFSDLPVAVLVGVILSLGWLVYVATRPPMPLLGRQAGTQVFRDLDENPADETFPGIAVLRVDGGACSSQPWRRSRIASATGRGRLAPPRARARPRGVNFIDSQGAAKMTELHDLAEADGVTLRLARVKPQVLAVLEADGIVERIGADRIHGNVHLAVEAQLADADC